LRQTICLNVTMRGCFQAVIQAKKPGKHFCLNRQIQAMNVPELRQNFRQSGNHFQADQWLIKANIELGGRGLGEILAVRLPSK